MRFGKFVAFAFCVGIASEGSAQTRQEALNLIAKGKLSAALEAENKLVAKKTVTGGDYQVQGLLLAANGQIALALNAFVAGIKLSKPAPAASGLEGLPYDSPLLRRLSLIRGSFAVSNGQAAFLNNIGLSELMLGRMRSGFNNLDAATQMANRFTAPYVNEAVGHLLKAEGSKAVTCAKKAISLGDSSVMTKSILADAEITVNRTVDARDDLIAALQDQPDHPIALSVMARYCEATGDSRGAERYRSQALANGAPIVVDGALGPAYTKGNVAGGSANEQHYNVDQRLFSPGKYGLGVNLASDKGRVQDRSDAYQDLSQGTAELGNALSALHFDYKDLAAGRPGTSTFEPGVTSNPTAGLAFHQANLYGDHQLGPILIHGRMRTSQANLVQADPVLLGHDNDTQLAGEFRYDFTKFGGKTTTGYAYSHLNRNQVNDLAIDPTEELLPDGRTDLWTAYFLHQRNLGPFAVLSVGGVLGHNGVALIADPYFDIALHLGSKNLLHVGFSSTFNSDVSDLMPDQMRAPDAIEDPVDRNQNATTPYNRNPLLLTQQGRQQTLQANLRTTLSPKLSFNTTAYHHDLQNFTIQGTDPQTATFLNQNVFSAGHATGVSESVAWDVARKLGLKLKTYVQTTRMEPQAGLFNGTQPGAPVPMDLPYFPGVGLDLGVDFHEAAWTGTLVASTIGHRTVATGVPLGPNGFCCSYIQVENPITSWNLFAHAQFGPGEGYIAVYNITKVSFYPGDPGRITFVIGVQL